MGRKFFIIVLICIVLVLGGCSSGGSQDQGQDCSVSQINKLSEYYNQQREKAVQILDEVAPNDVSGAYQQANAIFNEVSNYDPPACATTAHSHFVNFISKMTEGWHLQWDSEIAKASGDIVTATEKLIGVRDAVNTASEEYKKFNEEFEKLKK